MPIDLFSALVSEEKLHPNFKKLLEDDSDDVRAVIQSWSAGFEDRDGKFAQEFQTTFNSSFWELYLFAVLKSLHLEVEGNHHAPDFVVKDVPVAIEATIASHAADGVPEWEKTVGAVTDLDVLRSQTNAVVRASNAFHSKSRKYLDRYQRLEHVKGKSFVIAIANFGTEDFFMLGDVAMQWLLYDVAARGDVKKTNGASVPLGLFNDAEFSHISAVAYSSTATWGKARALGEGDDASVFQAIRIKDNTTSIRVAAKKSEYHESLTDGLRLFLNPYADHPLDVSCISDPGIRIFDANKDGSYYVTCHPDGDLCMRQVMRMNVVSE
ncbi:hypothetical protein [Phycobacter sp. K97]|uniref:hypothetical protein n=1 Tax=Phycobacter sedimenti TaxID=3133977 RepID=UPI00311E2307